ncbi:Fiber [Ovine adenovirus 7]|uniref:Fiber n=1 Tax=Ovine adenovirus D serotype 7 (isolate OAV287) TaxID=114430 RepID=Q83893_ADEO7|nr:fiber [Ovine adenovirus 7]AAA73919.1 Fiber [Ovine adenovirus 7]
MKRARWDPVYPFSEERLVPLPPFIEAGKGLKSEGLILSLNFTDPITINQTGFLTVKLGDGIFINGEGGLSSTAPKVKVPLTVSDETLQLLLSNSLTTESDSLALKQPQLPLKINDEGSLVLNLNTPLNLQNERLSLNVSNPLKIAADSLTINLKEPLGLQNESLGLNLSDPMNITPEGNLGIKLKNPMKVEESSLALNYKNPLAISNDALSINIANPLTVNTSGSLGISYSTPLRISNNALSLFIGKPLGLGTDGSLTVNLTRPLVCRQNTLAINYSAPLVSLQDNLTLSYAQPLTVSDNSLRLSLNSPLNTNSDGKLSVNYSNPLVVTDSNLTLSVKKPVMINNTGNVDLSFTAPIKLNDAEQLTLETTEPLEVADNALKLKLGKGLTVSNNALTLNLGNGLTFQQGLLQIKTNSSLGFNASGELSTATKQGTITVNFLSTTPIAFGWQIIPTTVAFIYILSGTQFTPQSPVTSLGFQPPQDFLDFFVLSPFVTSVTQIVGNDVKVIGLTISKNQSTITMKFTSPLAENVPVSMFTAHQFRQ